jgi:hypothetical protein
VQLLPLSHIPLALLEAALQWPLSCSGVLLARSEWHVLLPQVLR